MLRIVLIAAALAGAQTYENHALNAKYEPPAGWAMDKPDSLLEDFVSIRSTRVGLQPVLISFTKFSSASAAMYQSKSIHFSRMKTFYDGTSASTQAPVITDIQDTMAITSNGVFNYSSTLVKHIDLKRVMVSYSASFREYVQTFYYTTTTEDFNTNSALYFDNWKNTDFLSLTPTTTAKVAGSAPVKGQNRADIFDALGRKRNATHSNAPKHRIEPAYGR